MAASDDFLPGGESGRPGSAQLVRILLIVSLALNMFFLGAGAVILHRMLGQRERGGGFFIHAMHEDLPGPGMMLRSLPPESRPRIEAQIAGDRVAMRQALDAARQARREAYEALSANPFSVEIYRQKQTAAEAADLAAVRAVHKVLVAATVALTPDERMALIRALHDRKPGPAAERGPPRLDSPASGPPASGPPPSDTPPPQP
jgi:uncharacterized membrane protein